MKKITSSSIKSEPEILRTTKPKVTLLLVHSFMLAQYRRQTPLISGSAHHCFLPLRVLQQWRNGDQV